MRALLFAAPFLLALSARGQDVPANFPMHPLEAEKRMQYDAFEIVEAKRTESGVAGAQKMKLRFADGTEMKVKWKSAPTYTAEGWNNVPRKEVAAYVIQKWFLDPAEFVVPPTVTRCIPLEVFRKVEPDAGPTRVGGDCVFGAFSQWLESVKPVDRVVDLELFAADPTYARTLADVNIVGYLIQHRDGRKSNFLVSSVPGEPRLFSVDNGISFDVRVFNWFVRNISTIRVPALPRASIERLRNLTFDEVMALGILGQFERDGAGGELLFVAPDRNFDPARGSRVVAGAFQFGLSDEEISGVWERLGRLLRNVNEGRIELF